MTRIFLFIASLLLFAVATAAAQNFTPREESPEDFPAAAGRDETFYTCTACHNFRLVAAQGMNRRQWNESIDLMVSRHGMPAPDDKEREALLTYLETAFPPRAPSGGFQNPFLNR
jgi:mono/diheme cytochrome c family protein